MFYKSIPVVASRADGREPTCLALPDLVVSRAPGRHDSLGVADCDQV